MFLSLSRLLGGLTLAKSPQQAGANINNEWKKGVLKFNILNNIYLKNSEENLGWCLALDNILTRQAPHFDFFQFFSASRLMSWTRDWVTHYEVAFPYR